jgi:predicted nucleic acid-binding protein
MTFANISDGSQVFFDANILVYNAAADPTFGAACKQLLERVAKQQIEGFTSAHALCDLAHRLMTLEAIAQCGWQVKGIAQRLRKHPAEIQKLTRFRQAVDDIVQIGVQVLPIDFGSVSAATALSQQHGLMTGDALIVALMRQNGLTMIASEDADFDRVPGLTRYPPQ